MISISSSSDFVYSLVVSVLLMISSIAMHFSILLEWFRDVVVRFASRSFRYSSSNVVIVFYFNAILRFQMYSDIDVYFTLSMRKKITHHIEFWVIKYLTMV